ncbi:unnamed protein product [Arctogadus glacialis]
MSREPRCFQDPWFRKRLPWRLFDPVSQRVPVGSRAAAQSAEQSRHHGLRASGTRLPDEVRPRVELEQMLSLASICSLHSWSP